MASIKRHIPNVITCGNLFSGCIAVTMAFSGEFRLALLFIVLGAVFDFFDGLVARLLRVSSPMGVEIDSLADDVTFGFAPAAVVFVYMRGLSYPFFLSSVAEYIPYLAFLIAIFSAMRLAKFNIDKRQTSSFIGLPTPANALFWVSLVVGCGSWIQDNLHYAWLLMIALIFLFSYLLVSEIPMFSLKFKRLEWRANKIRYIFLLSILPMFILGLSSAVLIISWYVILSVIRSLRR